jgi:hypothetical protein
MHTQTNPGESEEFARLEWAILGLLTTPGDQRPWSQEEIGRAITPVPGSVHDAVERLYRVGLVHRWSRYVNATYAAVRHDEITQECHDNPAVEADRRMEGEILHVVLRTGEVMPMSEKDICRALRVKKKHKLPVLDALNRLVGAGLIERPGGLVRASEAAVRLDAIDNS